MKKIHRFNITNTKLNSLNLKDILIINQKDNTELLNQWKNVLKFKEGEQLKLFTGNDDYEYLFEVLNIERKSCEMILLEKIPNEINTKRIEINLYISIYKNDFEEGLRFATELGVTHIYPIISERTVRKEINSERVKKILIESSEQCGRMNIPTLHEVKPLNEALTGLDLNAVDTLSICYHTRPSTISPSKDLSYETINIFIGPEGGWSETEVGQFETKGLTVRNINNVYTLRALTAIPVCIYDAITLVK